MDSIGIFIDFKHFSAEQRFRSKDIIFYYWIQQCRNSTGCRRRMIEQRYLYMIMIKLKLNRKNETWKKKSRIILQFPFFNVQFIKGPESLLMLRSSAMSCPPPFLMVRNTGPLVWNCHHVSRVLPHLQIFLPK